MKFSIVLLAAATFVSAVEFEGQPPCASPCISQAITQGSPCGIEDIACQCESSNFAGITNAVIPCLLASCTGAGDIQSAQAAPNRCAAATEAGAGATTAASSGETSAASETTSASPASTTTSGPESTTSESSNSESTTTAPTTTAAAGGGGGNASVTTGSPSSTAGQVTQNVAHSVGFAGMGGMVGLLAAVVAAL